MTIKKVDQLIKPASEPANISKGVLSSELSEAEAYTSSSRTNTSKDHVDAINQMFAEFELAYHNQYHKAFPDEGALNLGKKILVSSLAGIPS